MGCSGSCPRSPTAVQQGSGAGRDAGQPEARKRRAKGRPRAALRSTSPIGSCSTVSTSASTTASVRSLQTLSAGGSKGQLSAHPEERRASPPRRRRTDSKDPRAPAFQSAARSRPVPRLGPVAGSSVMERRRSWKATGPPMLAAPCCPSTEKALSLQPSGSQPSHPGEAHAHTQWGAADF